MLNETLSVIFKHRALIEIRGRWAHRGQTLLISVVLQVCHKFHGAHSVWKSHKLSHLTFSISTFFTNFGPIKIVLYGNTVWQQVSDFQKVAKIDHFRHSFVHSKCKRSSLRSQFWMRLFCDFQTLWEHTQWIVLEAQSSKQSFGGHGVDNKVEWIISSNGKLTLRVIRFRKLATEVKLTI